MGVCDPSTGDQGNNGGIMPKQSAKKAKRTGAKASKQSLRDLEVRKTDAAKGGLGNTSRFDPYRNYRFRPS